MFDCNHLRLGPGGPYRYRGAHRCPVTGCGSKSWRTHSLKEAAHQLHQFAPNANVPYQICVAELVAHLPTSGKTIAFDPTGQTKMLPDGNHDHPTGDT